MIRSDIPSFVNTLDGKRLSTIGRCDLIKILLKKAQEDDNIKIHYEKSFTDVNYDEGIIYFGDNESYTYDWIFACDGALSYFHRYFSETLKKNFVQPLDDRGI